MRDVVGVQVTSTQQSDPAELDAQQQREVASWKVAVDLNGTMNGTAYFGGWHGTSALPRPQRVGDERHLRPGLRDRTRSTCTASSTAAPIRAAATCARSPVTPEGDLWMGDADVISFMPQRSAGANADFFQHVAIPGQPNASSLDVFPGVADNTFGLAIDSARGLYVASYGNGLAYLAPRTRTRRPIGRPRTSCRRTT